MYDFRITDRLFSICKSHIFKHCLSMLSNILFVILSLICYVSYSQGYSQVIHRLFTLLKLFTGSHKLFTNWPLIHNLYTYTYSCISNHNAHLMDFITCNLWYLYEFLCISIQCYGLPFLYRYIIYTYIANVPLLTSAWLRQYEDTLDTFTKL